MDMEIDNDGNNGDAPEITNNGLRLYPVSAHASGEGLPYAPVDWPEPGDIWRWKVGKRVRPNGYFIDRYLYLPERLQSMSKGRFFASKLQVEQYLQTIGADVKAFFSSFSWKVPSRDLPAVKGEHSEAELQAGIVCCKAGNESCGSLVELKEVSPEFMSCDICCSEPYFCRDCCCILCSKTIILAEGSYNHIRCEAAMEEGTICGHIAHIGCALRSHMAGTVGGTIGLDAEYYCRRCDARTDLLLHVRNLLQKCISIESRDEILKTLIMGTCVLRGSERPGVKKLLQHIELVMGKLKSGTSLDNVWKVEDGLVVDPGTLICDANDASESSAYKNPPSSQATSLQLVSQTFDPVIESLKLETKADEVLAALRQSQDSEYNIARERLYEQKRYLQILYQQLDKERAELAQHAVYNADREALFKVVMDRVDQIKKEAIKLNQMGQVANGFGRTPVEILKEHFDLHP